MPQIKKVIEIEEVKKNSLKIEGRYQLLLQNLNCIVYGIDLKTFKPAFFDGSVFEITGHLPEDFLDRKISWLEIIHKDDLQLVKSEAEKLLNVKNYVADNEYRIINKNGDIKWIRDIANFISDESNATGVLEGILYDITETKKIEEQLRESEERYRAFFENSLAITLIIDPDTSQILDANTAACEFYGWSLSEITKKKIGEINTLSHEEIIREIENVRTQKRKHFFFKHRLANGDVRDVEVFSGPITIKGKPVIYSLVKDITENKKLQEDLLQMQFSIEKARDSIFWIDSEANIVYVNESACNSLEYTKSELLKLTIFDIDPQFKKEIWNGHWEKTRNMRSYKVETFHKTKNGRIFPVEISIDFFTFGGKDYHAAFARDITERRQAEESLQRNKNMLDESQRIALIGSWEIDLFTNELIWSDETFRILGVNNRVFQPSIDNLIDLIIEEDKEKTRIHFNKNLETGEFKDLEYRVAKTDGTITWIHNTGKVYKDENGTPIKMIGTVQDITDRVIIEKELKNSEEKFFKAFNTSPDSIIITRLSDGNYIEVNDGFTELTGYTKEEIIGKSSLEISVWVDLNSRSKFLEEITKNNEVKNFEALFRLKNGIIRTGLMSARIIDLNGEKCILSITRDITDRIQDELALRESEETFRRLFEESADPILLLDGNTFIDCNQATVNILKFNFKNEIIGNSPWSISPEYQSENITSIDKAQQMISIAMKKGHNRFEWLHTRADGSILPVEVMLTSINLKGKQIFYVMWRDITERKEAEKALRESEERFHLMFKNNGAVMLLIEPETGKIIDANSAASQFYGYPIEKLCSMSVDEINVLSYDEITKERELAAKAKRNHFILKHRLANGEIRIVEAYSSPFTVNGKTYIFGIVHDITERDKVEHELRVRSAALEAAANAIVITDSRGNMQWTNNAFTKLTGYRFEEVIGKNLRILKSGQQDSDYYKRLWETILSGKVWYEEITNKRKDGTFYTEEQTIAPVKDKSGNISHFISIKQDISERKRFQEELIIAKEQAEISEKLKSAFLAQMSHEIRSPLYRILGYVSLIKDYVASLNPEEEVKEYFTSIDLSSHRLIRTIDSILNMSELQTQSYAPTFSNVNLSELMKRLQMEYTLQANMKSLNLKIECLTNNSTIRCDEYSTTQIFANLIDNSLKYTETGGVNVVIDRDKEKQLFVEVNDTGIGMSTDFMKILFSPFTQEETGYTRKFEGNGLGLALVKSYCDLNNASVEVKSRKGKGTAFRVTFRDNT